jgi:hypothetical protein
MITDKREIAKLNIASILDHPSVFMGGPSQQNRKRAERVLEYLEQEGLVSFSNGDRQ